MLDLFQPFSEGFGAPDASSSTPTSGGDPEHEVVFTDVKLPAVVTDAGGDTSTKDTKRE